MRFAITVFSGHKPVRTHHANDNYNLKSGRRLHAMRELQQDVVERADRCIVQGKFTVFYYFLRILQWTNAKTTDNPAIAAVTKMAASKAAATARATVPANPAATRAIPANPARNPVPRTRNLPAKAQVRANAAAMKTAVLKAANSFNAPFPREQHPRDFLRGCCLLRERE